MKSNLRKIWDVISTVLVVLIVIFAIGLVGVRLVGINPYAVLSGSMEPTYHVGSLLYVKDVDYTELKAGDAITYVMDENENICTHRIVEVVVDEDDPSIIRFRTKGDANDTEDGNLVYYKNVIGKPLFSIPYLGYVANYVQNPPGLYVAIAVVAILIVMNFLPDLLDGVSGKKKEEEPSVIAEALEVSGQEKEVPAVVEAVETLEKAQE